MQDISQTTVSANYIKSGDTTGPNIFSITSQQQQIQYLRQQKPDDEKTRDELLIEIQQLRAISNSNKNARIMLDEMYQFVALLDVNGNLLDVNEPALQGGGMIRSSIQGIPFWDCRWWATSQENIDNVREAVHKASKGEFIRYETEIFGKSAGTEKITIDFSLMPLFNDKGEVSLILPEGRNITEKRQGELEIERKNNELRSLYEKIKELDELKTQFFANVSHELRTPLALIVGPTDKLLKDTSVDINVRKDLEIVARNARGLLKIVNNLLDISRLEAGKMNLNYSMVNLGQTVHLIASCFEILAREKQLEFSIITPNEPMMAAIDADKMQRVITNLISNAFKFTPSGGHVKCVLEKFDRSPSEPGFQIIVSDTGPGIPDNLHEIIFERFRQVDGTSTRKHGGTGLGLSIVKEFVTLHNGTVTIHNISTGGAQFTLRIPITPNLEDHLYKKSISDSNISEIQQQIQKNNNSNNIISNSSSNNSNNVPTLPLSPQHNSNSNGSSGNGLLISPSASSNNLIDQTNTTTTSKTTNNIPNLKDNMGSIMGIEAIAQQAVEELTEKQFYQSQENIQNKPIVLVVEDNPEMNRFIAELLSKFYFVVTAFDGVEGIEKTRSLTPDLIVTDCMMPRMSGDEMVEQLRSDEQFDNIPILLLTAKADENLRIKLLQNGVSDYVNKPFSSDELVARVVNLMTMKKAKQFLQEELSSANTDLQELINQLTNKKRDLQALVGELEKERNLLNNTNKSKDEFFMNLSHELRTPLNGILGWCQLLLYDIDSGNSSGSGNSSTPSTLSTSTTTSSSTTTSTTPLHDESTIRTGLETIERCASSQNQLINDLLDMSLIIGDKFTLLLSDVDLPTLIQNAISSILVTAQSKKISVISDIQLDNSNSTLLSSGITGDKSRLQQVVWNLLSNSIKFTKENGQINLNLKVVNQIPTSELGFCSNPSFNPINRHGDKWILFTITDNGKGIPKQFLPSVFDRFKQADCSSTRSYGGLGIGLSITQNIIHLHKGAVYANSEGENKGSQFTVVLPIIQKQLSNSNSPSLVSCTSSPPLIKKPFFNQPTNVNSNSTNNNSTNNNNNSANNNSLKRQREEDDDEKLTNSTPPPPTSSISENFLPCSSNLIPSPYPLVQNTISNNQTSTSTTSTTSTTTINSSPNDKIATMINSLPLPSPSPSFVLPFSSDLLKSPTNINNINNNNNNQIRSPKTNKNILSGIQIMLVDDLEETTHLFSSMLYKLGAKRIDTFQRVSDAYAFLCDSSKSQPDIILSDLTMPFEDGYSMVRKLRDREKINTQNKKTPIIALTASVSSFDKEKVLKSGFDLHCCKPVNFLELSNSILSLIEKYNTIVNIDLIESNNNGNRNSSNGGEDDLLITDNRPSKKANIS